MPSLRMKCASCKHVADLPANAVCPSCGAAMPPVSDSYIQIYRMGSPIGIAVGYGVYLNEEPYGHIANKQSARIPLPYGTYKLHLTCGMTRKCKDMTITLSEENPTFFVKAHIRPGFWTNTIVPEPAEEKDMPPLD